MHYHADRLRMRQQVANAGNDSAWRCPRCGQDLPLSLIERWRPLISRTYAFNCPACHAKLSIDYWGAKINFFRLAYVAGVVAIFWLISQFDWPLWVTGIILCLYVALGWVILQRFRRIIVL